MIISERQLQMMFAILKDSMTTESPTMTFSSKSMIALYNEVLGQQSNEPVAIGGLREKAEEAKEAEKEEDNQGIQEVPEQSKDGRDVPVEI